jgi:hypothetical protein
LPEVTRDTSAACPCEVVCGEVVNHCP